VEALDTAEGEKEGDVESEGSGQEQVAGLSAPVKVVMLAAAGEELSRNAKGQLSRAHDATLVARSAHGDLAAHQPLVEGKELGGLLAEPGPGRVVAEARYGPRSGAPVLGGVEAVAHRRVPRIVLDL
jgi:hypothetical protein